MEFEHAWEDEWLAMPEAERQRWFQAGRGGKAGIALEMMLWEMAEIMSQKRFFLGGEELDSSFVLKPLPAHSWRARLFSSASISL